LSYIEDARCLKINAARTHETLKVRSEVTIEDLSNAMWERMGNSVLNVTAIYCGWASGNRWPKTILMVGRKEEKEEVPK
jgi:hypothetical protein